MIVGQQAPGSYTYTLSCSNGTPSASNSAVLTVVTPQATDNNLSRQIRPQSQWVSRSPSRGHRAGADSCVATAGWPAPCQRLARKRCLSPTRETTISRSNASAPPVTVVPRPWSQGLVATVSLAGESDHGRCRATRNVDVELRTGNHLHGFGRVVWHARKLGLAGGDTQYRWQPLYSMSCGNPGALAQASVSVTASVRLCRCQCSGQCCRRQNRDVALERSICEFMRGIRCLERDAGAQRVCDAHRCRTRQPDLPPRVRECGGVHLCGRFGDGLRRAGLPAPLPHTESMRLTTVS